jgi:hypothetical protein
MPSDSNSSHGTFGPGELIKRERPSKPRQWNIGGRNYQGR